MGYNDPTPEEEAFEARVDMVAETITEHAYRHRISNSPYGHVCPATCLAAAVLRRIEREARTDTKVEAADA